MHCDVAVFAAFRALRWFSPSYTKVTSMRQCDQVQLCFSFRCLASLCAGQLMMDGVIIKSPQLANFLALAPSRWVNTAIWDEPWLWKQYWSVLGQDSQENSTVIYSWHKWVKTPTSSLPLVLPRLPFFSFTFPSLAARHGTSSSLLRPNRLPTHSRHLTARVSHI